MKQLRFAFAGFRHDHITSLYRRVTAHPECTVVAAAEENGSVRSKLAASGKAEITHCSITEMLDSVECDCVAIGDCYGRRGAIAADALRRGKHVITDKPLCTSLAELETIRQLAEEKSLTVGCMYTLRDNPAVMAVKSLIDSGRLGKILQVQFTAQHPLMRDTRPEWYFEKDMHGGTINDIGCHAFDIIPYLTGSPIERIVGARSWQALEKDSPFHDAGQFMLALADGCGVMGDVSYCALDRGGYAHPAYWRFNFWGSEGMVEFHHTSTRLRCFLKGVDGETLLDVPESSGEGYFEGFLAEISGRNSAVTTGTVLEAAYWSLAAQAAADGK